MPIFKRFGAGQTIVAMRVSFVLFVAYLLVLIKLLFFKVRLAFSSLDISRTQSASVKEVYKEANFVPFRSIRHYASRHEAYLVGVLNIVGNVLLFLPMGYFLPLFFKRINSAPRLAAVVALTSLFVEVTQLLTKTGQFDIDDVILNTVGGVIGYFIFTATKQWFNDNKKPRKR